MKKHNLFITLEGGEGAGKSTVSKLLKEKFSNEDIKTLLTREPGGTGLVIAEQIRKVIFEALDMDVSSELLLFAASRREHVVKVIEPSLEKNKLVICDRFSDSTRVYQGIVKGVDKKIVDATIDIATQGTVPNLTFIFDLDPVVGQQRINDGSISRNRFDNETIEFHQKLRAAYLSIASEDNRRYVVIDASKPVKEVANEIYDIIKQRINEIN